MPPSHTPDDPGPYQRKVNTRQGELNEAQGDLNERLVDEAELRRDERFDDHGRTNAEQDDTNLAQAETNVRREAEFDAQGVTNAEQAQANADQTVTNLDQAITNQAQDETNADQSHINDAAMAALSDVAKATDKIADLLRINVTRSRRETAVLALLVAAIIVLGTIGFVRFRSDGEHLRRNNARLESVVKHRCEDRNAQLAQVKAEFVTFIQQAVSSNPDPAARVRGEAFLAEYRTGLDRRLQPIDCTP